MDVASWHCYFRGVLARRVFRAQAEHHPMLRQLRAHDLAGLEESVRNTITLPRCARGVHRTTRGELQPARLDGEAGRV